MGWTQNPRNGLLLRLRCVVSMHFPVIQPNSSRGTGILDALLLHGADA